MSLWRRLNSPALIVWACAGLLGACAQAGGPERLQPSGQAAGVPEAGQPFSDYVRYNRQTLTEVLSRLRFSTDPVPFGAAYSLQQVVEMRSPWQRLPAMDCEPREPVRIGFLLIHGLSDSPYTLRSIGRSLAQAYPCAVVRSVLLPGHGTVPGDLLEVDRRQWLEAMEYGVDSFRGGVDALYLVGYSSGAALSVHYADSSRRRWDCPREPGCRPGCDMSGPG